MNPESAITHFIISEPGADHSEEPDDGGEQFWGEILERTCSMNNMNYSEGISKQENREVDDKVSMKGEEGRETAF